MALPLAALLAAAFARPAFAADMSDDMARAAAFFKGRSVTLISGATPDGGDEQQDRIFSGMTIVSRGEAAAPAAGRDAAARLLARHLPRHVVGAPTVELVTLPGAGGRRAARHLAEAAPRDASVIGLLERGLAGAPADYGWIGAFAPDTALLVARRDAGFHEAGELRTRELVVGATAPQDEAARLARGLRDSLGLKLRLVGGYRGIGALHQAIERGEVSGYVAGHAGEVQAALLAWLQSGDAFALLQIGPRALPWLADAPLAASLARDARESAALERLLAPQRLGLPLATPPGVPAERLAALRAGFAAMARDEAFKQEAMRAGVAADIVEGAAFDALIREIAAQR